MDSTGQSVHPLVTIGVPVFNGERFIARTLDSLLNQTVMDFEIIISDNALTDDTQSICEDYARRDRRIRYIRQSDNFGAASNWNFLVHEARGKFFKWSSSSDYCSPVMLERCIGVMQDDASIALCYGRTQIVDEDERKIEICAGDTGYEDARPSDRFAHVRSSLQLNNPISGVFRLDILLRTRLILYYPSGDLVLPAELALHGKLCMLPDVLLFRRKAFGTFTYMLTPLELQRIYQPKATVPMRLIRARRHMDYMISFLRAPIPISEKFRAWLISLKFLIWDREALILDLLSFFKDSRR